MAAEILPTHVPLKRVMFEGKVALGGVKEGRRQEMPQMQKKEKCPDCEQCQVCTESRCRLCRGERREQKASELGSGFTYGEYLAWKNKRTSETNQTHVPGGTEPMGLRETVKTVPVMDRYGCTDCDSCISLRPDIFKRNPDTGCLEVTELPDYPENEIEQVMGLCPGGCITWQ